jgi:hypothetical protein
MAEIDLAAEHRHGAVAVHGEKGIGSSDRGAAVASWAGAWVRTPAKTKPTVSAPPLRTARRVNRCGMIGAVISASLF